jgi:hypothetical protein
MRRITMAIALTITLLLSTIHVQPVTADQEWVTPSYPARASEEHTVTLKYSYTYEERQLTPSYSIEPLPATVWNFASPESAMIARASAMKQLDYENWLATWDQSSQAEMQQRARQNNRELSDIVDQWRGILEVGRMVMVRRIQTGQYVILTYRVVDDSGRDIGQIELPSVFHLVKDRWLGSQELSSDILLLESPWVTGTQHVERTLR